MQIFLQIFGQVVKKASPDVSKVDKQLLTELEIRVVLRDRALVRRIHRSLRKCLVEHIQTSIVKTRQANRWHHLMAYSCSERGIVSRRCVVSYWRGLVLYICLIGCRLPPLDGYVSSFKNRLLWNTESMQGTLRKVSQD